jgi:hypothetical protein
MDDNTRQRKQRLLIFQQNDSGRLKIEGLRSLGEDLFELEIISIDEPLPPVLDDSSDYLPQELDCDLVLDFLKHHDLSSDLARLCQQKKIPMIASGKKIVGSEAVTPPT